MGSPKNDQNTAPDPVRGSIRAAITARLIQHAVANGIAEQPLLAAVGWSSATAPGPDVRVPFPKHWGVWQQIHSQGVLGDFGLSFADSFELEHLGVLGMLMTHSATVEEAMSHQTRYQRLLLDVPFKVTRLLPTRIVIEHPVLPIASKFPHMIGAGLGYWVKLLRLLLNKNVCAKKVELPHPPLANPERYELTFGTRPRFNAERIVVEFDRALWDAPVRAPRSGIEAYLRARASALLQDLPSYGEGIDRVREYIVEELRHGRPPTLNGAAKRLRTSTRTLQRSLQAAKMSYNALLDHTRQQLSIEYLADDRLSIGEVAVVLGYSEPATFYRAFKRWTGKAPGAYRTGL